MSRTATRKQQEQRRRREKLARAKEQRKDPFRLAASKSVERGWYANEDWPESGQALVVALRRTPDGLLALVAFQIDLWCMGLQDAWGRLDLEPQEWEEQRREFRERGLRLVEIEPGFARELVAGSIRFASENGFRLPRRYERWVELAGGAGDVASAPLRHFGCDGRLLYVGPIERLRQKLVGCSVEEFLDRPDVDFATGGGPERLRELFGEAHRRVLDDVRRWALATGSTPHPRLDEALEILLETALVAPEEGEQGERFMTAAVNLRLGVRPADDAADLTAALLQAKAFLDQFPSAQDLCAALGIEPGQGPWVRRRRGP